VGSRDVGEHRSADPRSPGPAGCCAAARRGTGRARRREGLPTRRRRAHLDEFVAAYQPAARAGGVRAVPPVPYEELIARDEVNLDITWLEDDTLEDPDSLPVPDVLIAEHREEMAAILKQSAEIAVCLGVEPLEPADIAE
jgi:hypothetical protein